MTSSLLSSLLSCSGCVSVAVACSKGSISIHSLGCWCVSLSVVVPGSLRGNTLVTKETSSKSSSITIGSDGLEEVRDGVQYVLRKLSSIVCPLVCFLCCR